MKFLLLLLLTGSSALFTNWLHDFDAAKKKAKATKRLILLNFSGSDWCGPCIQLRKEVFDSDPFSRLADTALVLLNADFPRNKKNQLPKDQQKQNDALADTYNPTGKFPFTLLLTADGKVIKSWEGFPQANSELFINQVKAACHANDH